MHRRSYRALIFAIVIASSVFAPIAEAGKAAKNMATVSLPNSSPLVTFRLLFNVGAASDPKGKEGLAALTASLLAGGGSRELTYEEIVSRMYPMATGFNSQVDKEMTVFYGTTHRDNLETYYQLISGMLLAPGWRADDFTRLREDAINYLKVGLRQSNDEELGKEALYNFIYGGNHPYGHNNTGTIAALERLTLDDVKKFYAEHYTQANFVLGLAGGYPKGFEEKVQRDFAAHLPAGRAEAVSLPQPAPINGLEMEVIEKNTPGTAISFGFPVAVTRKDPDWPALLVVQSYLGQHRSSNSYLYQRLREIRGLNYGDYAYIEYFPRGMFQFHPDPNLARQQQIFQVWIRPVEPKNGLFALRAGLYELNKLVRDGMSEKDFEATRQFLSKFVNVLTKDQDAQLGYALDSRYYGLPSFTDYVRAQLAKLTLADVNRAIKKYLAADRVKIVVVTQDAKGFRDRALSGQPTPISYTSPPAKEILEEDKLIESYKLNLDPKRAAVVPVEQVFQQ
ncbi:MAG TPA: pitrilysin family protein [Blastocatellia bacterium]|nr:pitrilysin family protein [Blastocatellia bacterium]